MNATDWIARSLALLKPAAKPPAAAADTPRPMAERLRATLRREP